MYLRYKDFILDKIDIIVFMSTPNHDLSCEKNESFIVSDIIFFIKPPERRNQQISMNKHPLSGEVSRSSDSLFLPAPYMSAYTTCLVLSLSAASIEDTGFSCPGKCVSLVLSLKYEN